MPISWPPAPVKTAMPTLREVQADLAAFIMGDDGTGAANHVVEDGIIAAARRINIHRNNYRGGLVGALRITYPAIDRLVGEAFFDGAAARFVAGHAPPIAYLNAYGDGFGDFLATFPPASALPYLADVARLEWAANCAANAPDAPVIDPSALAGLDEADQARVRFIAHPATRMIQIGYDADAIRRAVMARDQSALASLSPRPDRFWLIVHRLGLEVVTRRLTDIEARFTTALLDGQPLGLALSPESIEAEIALLAEHLASGRFTGFELVAQA